MGCIVVSEVVHERRCLPLELDVEGLDDVEPPSSRLPSHNPVNVGVVVHADANRRIRVMVFVSTIVKSRSVEIITERVEVFVIVGIILVCFTHRRIETVLGNSDPLTKDRGLEGQGRKVARLGRAGVALRHNHGRPDTAVNAPRQDHEPAHAGRGLRAQPGSQHTPRAPSGNRLQRHTRGNSHRLLRASDVPRACRATPVPSDMAHQRPPRDDARHHAHRCGARPCVLHHRAYAGLRGRATDKLGHCTRRRADCGNGAVQAQVTVT